MRRNGIVDHRFHTVVREILTQFIATRTENGEDMIDTVAMRLNYSHEGIAYFSLIAGSNLLPTGIVSVEIAKFHVEDGGMDLIDAGITAEIVEDVFLRRAVIAKRLNSTGEVIIIGGHSTCIA